MLKLHASDYLKLLDSKMQLGSDTVFIGDHLMGFDKELRNPILDYIAENQLVNQFLTQYYFDSKIKTVYSNISIGMSINLQNERNLSAFHDYKTHPEIAFDNFLCSFNGTPHVGRKLLTAVLEKFGLFSRSYCSKNFSYSLDEIDGHVQDYLDDSAFQILGKFFTPSHDFAKTVYSFGHVRFDHSNNIYNLESKLTKSFLHLVSETMATSYYPFVTEKFLYSVVTRGLFLAYAQPGWHAHLEKYYGFKLYNKIFDYSFDQIQNPVVRLIELLSMISKFSVLTKDEWNDLYLIERDTIEYNYEHYFRKNFLGCLKQHVDY